MVKYIATAAALKAFSSTAVTRRIYRGIGNRLGGERRRTGKMPAFYVDRVKRMLRLARQQGIVKNGDRILELGTGWLHWEALTLRLFFDIEAVLYDVWDNRQLGGMKNYLGQLAPLLNSGMDLSAAELKRAQSMIEAILKVKSFEELYKMLGFEYVCEASGSLGMFKDSSFNLVVSAGVLEHVYREAVPILINETHRVLKPGGSAVHSIDTADHLSHYDLKVSAKMYLTVSESKWRTLYQNDVQYINRIQRGEWLEIFSTAKFDLLEQEVRQVDISKLKLAERYASMDKRDLECTVVRVALKKRA